MSARAKAVLQGILYGLLAGAAISLPLYFVILPAMVRP